LVIVGKREGNHLQMAFTLRVLEKAEHHLKRSFFEGKTAYNPADI
jgi:hypothetical protein